MFPFLSRRRFLACALAPLALLAALLAVPGCDTYKDPPKYLPLFYMEAPPTAGVAFTMPDSKLQYRRLPDPFLTVGDLQWIRLGSIDVRGVTTLCIYFQFTDQAKQELYLQSARSPGRHIFFFENPDKPTGARLIDGPIDGGLLFVITDTADAKEIQQLVDDLQTSLTRFQEMRKSKSI